MENKFAILIVDDDHDLISNLQDILEVEGYSVTIANDGRTAIALVDNNIFDLALVDIKLPDMSGEDLIKKLVVISPEVEYIIMTGYASLDSAIDAVGEKNIVGYLTKPINIEYLILLIGQVLERTKAEELLKNQLEKYRGLVNNVNLGVFRSSPKANEGLIEVNPAMEKITGYSREELLTMKEQELYVYPEERGKVIALATSGHTTRELLFKKKDGEVITVLDVKTAIKDKGGKVLFFDGILNDITEYKRGEEKIRQAAEEWKTTFDSIVDLVSIHDRNFRIVRVNRATASALNMKPEELIGKKCYEIFHGTAGPVFDCPHIKALEEKEPASNEFFEPHLGIHIEMTASPIFNEQGEVIASVHITRDITERKNMEEQLMLTDRLASIGQLAAGITHEINNPLTSVVGFSESLLEKDFPDEIKEDLAIINKEAKRIVGVVKGLLTFVRSNGTEKILVDINSIAQDVLRLRSYEQRVCNIEIDKRFAPELPLVMANESQMQQVFMNLIVNAEQAMLETNGRGRLKVTTERAGYIVRASISDDGPGISPGNMKKLFTPFFTTKKVGKGTGLGLSICHGIVTEHNGRIYAESELGKGASFFLELPIPTDEGESNEKP